MKTRNQEIIKVNGKKEEKMKNKGVIKFTWIIKTPRTKNTQQYEKIFRETFKITEKEWEQKIKLKDRSQKKI